MPKQSEHRLNIVAAAAKLFRAQGYAATGLAEILDLSEAPKGSLYHYFPGGKEDVGATAVRAAGKTAARTLEGLAADGRGAAELVLAFADMLGGWLEKTEYREGCPVATVLLEMAPQSDKIAQAGRGAFALWTEVIAGRLAAQGVAETRAMRLAMFAVASIEGGLVLARVERDLGPLRAAAEETAEAFRAAIAAGASEKWFDRKGR